jgi:hypothetical protein
MSGKGDSCFRDSSTTYYQKTSQIQSAVTQRYATEGRNRQLQRSKNLRLGECTFFPIGLHDRLHNFCRSVYFLLFPRTKICVFSPDLEDENYIG